MMVLNTGRIETLRAYAGLCQRAGLHAMPNARHLRRRCWPAAKGLTDRRPITTLSSDSVLKAVSNQAHSQAFDFERFAGFDHDGFVVGVFRMEFDLMG